MATAKINPLTEKFKNLKILLKKRGKEFSQEEFNEELDSLLTQEYLDALLLKYSPDEFLVKERMKNDEDFKNRVLELMGKEASL